MYLIELDLNENILEPVRIPPIVSNSKGVYTVMVNLNRTWERMDIKGVFQCGEVLAQADPVPLFVGEEHMAKYFTVPDEMLRTHGRALFFGMVGTIPALKKSEMNATITNIVMPTQMLALGNVIEGAKLTVEPGPAPEPEPEPEIPEV